MISKLSNFFFPTQSNGYSPKIFGRKYLSIMLAFLIVFNVFAGQIFPSFVQKAQAASYSAGELIQLTNSSRISAGLVPLNYSKTLETAAYAKAQDMLNKNYWAHFGPNGETPWQFMTAQGYIYQYAGENLGRGFSSAGGLHDAWMASPTHYANIMKSEFRDIGIAIVDGELQGEQTTLIVQFFGALPGAQTVAVSSSSVSSTTSQNIATNPNPTSVSASTSTNRNNVATPIVEKFTKSVLTPKPEFPPSTPKITEPTDNSVFNTNDISFKGTGEVDSTIQLYQDENKVGESIVDGGGVWTFRNSSDLSEGKYVFKANAVGKNTLISPYSNVVNLVIDKTAPSLTLQSISGDDNSSINHNFILGYKVQNLQSEHLNIEISKQGKPTQDFNYNPEDGMLTLSVNLNDLADLQVTIKDDVGNSSELSMSESDLKSQIFSYLKDKLGDNSVSYVIDSTKLQSIDKKNNILDVGALQGTIESLNVKQKVNISFASGLIFLSMFDFLVLYKKKISLSRAKNLLHIPQFAAILALALLQGFGIII